MDYSMTVAKLWRMSALLLLLDAVLIFSYVWQPIGIPSGPSTWDFRVAALRDFENHQSVDAPRLPIKVLLGQYFAPETAATTIQPFWQPLPIEVAHIQAPNGTGSVL